jgi:hypothetical protein
MKFKSIIMGIGLLSSASAFAAPVQWVGNGHWYDFISTSVTAPQAFALAQASTFSGMQGYLATITSAEENLFVAVDIAGGNQAWIGGSDDGDEGNWTWRNGPEIGQAFTYTNWAGGEPNNCCGGENYVVTNWGSTTWNDIGPSAFPDYTSYYVIEYSAPVPEPETYAMLLAGLGLLGFAAQRRKKLVA